MRSSVSWMPVWYKKLHGFYSINLKMKRFSLETSARWTGHYSEGGFWSKVKRLGQRAGAKLIYFALLLFYVVQLKKASAQDLLLVVGALGYLIAPFDFVPDMIPVAGLADDAAALMAVIRVIKGSLDAEVRAAARTKTRELLGDADFDQMDKEIG